MLKDRAALLLGRSDVAALMDQMAWLEAARAAFLAVAEGRADVPPPLAVEGDRGIFHAKAAGLLLDRRYVALKLNGNFPGNRANHGLPTIQGVILLCDGATGRLLAIIDSIEVTLRRTAAATALAAKFLARPDSRTVLICGCGDQAPAQLNALRGVLSIKRVLCWDADAARAKSLAAAVGGTSADDVEASARLADVIVTCTTATAPIMHRHMAAPGSFIAAVGADSPHKNEIAPELMAAALVVVDSRDQCAAMGDLRHAVAAGAMSSEQVHADLSELVAGLRPGRTADEQITLFDSTGMAVQDVTAAVAIHERAVAAGACRTVALGA